MDAVTIRVAKTKPSQVVSGAKAREEHPAGLKRRFGALLDIISVGPAFFEPLPDDELAAWEK